MHRHILALSAALAFVALPQLALADGDGVVTGAAGGAVAGAVVGGPPGALVGGVAGGVIGGSVTGPRPATVVVQPDAPCSSRTTQTADNSGNSRTTQTTNCPD
jgi:hypothetical protein